LAVSPTLFLTILIDPVLTLNIVESA
jgi:hypothetical protein